MDWTQVITALISAAAGGGLGSLLTYKAKAKEQENDEFRILIAEYKEMLKANRNDIENLQHQIDELKAQLSERELTILGLQNRLIIFESSHTDIPLPMWLKDTKGVMLFLNDEYEKQILHPIDMTKADYIGRTDRDVWAEEIADAWRENDLKIMRTKSPQMMTEHWYGPDGMIEGRVVKYPRFLNRTVIGIGGICIEYHPMPDSDKLERPPKK